jgi:NAD(P)-dependent dehydrogenase (short-subunit alcohol dehydrogenase family)
MVAIDTVRASNAALKSNPPGLVALFIGATRGIGAATVRQLIKNLKAPIFYIVGRSEPSFSSQLSELKKLNPEASVTFLETEVSLIKNVDWISKKFGEKETRLDLLFMSPGFLPVGGPICKFLMLFRNRVSPTNEDSDTDEGIDTCMSLSYYARIRLTVHLLPLLQNAPSPRVLSVLAGGKERRLFTQDLSLQQNYSFLNVIDQTTTMHTLTFERLATENPSISFLHSYPGLVQTEIVQNAWLSETGRSPRWLVSLVSWMLRLVFLLIATTVDECGERQAFLATSLRFSPRKGGVAGEVFLVNEKCEDGRTRSNQKALKLWRAEGMVEKVWLHTMGIFTDALSCGSSNRDESLETGGQRPKMD